MAHGARDFIYSVILYTAMGLLTQGLRPPNLADLLQDRGANRVVCRLMRFSRTVLDFIIEFGLHQEFN